MAWTNPTNVAASDDSRATASITSPNSTHWITCTNFGFSLPAGAVVTGIVVEVEGSDATAPGTTNSDLFAKLIKGGTIGGTELSATNVHTSTDAYDTLGSSSNLWGNTLADTDVEASDFGVAIRLTCASGFGSASPRIDHVRMTVHYVVPSAAITGTAVPSSTQAQIKAGGQTIIITLTDAQWVAAGASFDGQRQNIINGLDSNQGGAAAWDAVVKATQGVSGVVRTSATVVTITLDAFPSYVTAILETITATIPASAITVGGPLVGSPTFTVLPARAILPPQQKIYRALMARSYD